MRCPIISFGPHERRRRCSTSAPATCSLGSPPSHGSSLANRGSPSSACTRVTCLCPSTGPHSPSPFHVTWAADLWPLLPSQLLDRFVLAFLARPVLLWRCATCPRPLWDIFWKLCSQLFPLQKLIAVVRLGAHLFMQFLSEVTACSPVLSHLLKRHSIPRSRARLIPVSFCILVASSHALSPSHRWSLDLLRRL
jgi:hypothetical protein